MLVFTIRNAVLIALVQVAIIVTRVLAAGISHKWWATPGIQLPQTTLFLINYGVVLLSAPVVWIALALRLRISHLPDSVKSIAFLSGFLLILILLVLIGHAVITPWIRNHFEGFDRAPEEARLFLPRSA